MRADPSAIVPALADMPSVADLAKAIESNDLVVFYQPKIDTRSLRMVSVEALVRWRHKSLGLVSPGVFVPVAEEHGLIGAMTTSVLSQGLRQCAQWASIGLDICLAINVSAHSLSDLSLPDAIAKMVAKHNIKPSRLVIEITESWINEDKVAAMDILTRMRIKGFNLSIDDFGTGYSSLRQLREIPFSEMKLDQSFLRNAAVDADARAIAELSIELGHRLGLHVVAEGVENQRDWDLIAELGCDEGQGHFIARPMRGEAVVAWLEHWNRNLGPGLG